MKKELEEISDKLNKAFSNLVIKECEVCGRFIGEKEFNDGEGACFKCWDKGNLT